MIKPIVKSKLSLPIPIGFCLDLSVSPFFFAWAKKKHLENVKKLCCVKAHTQFLSSAALASTKLSFSIRPRKPFQSLKVSGESSASIWAWGLEKEKKSWDYLKLLTPLLCFRSSSSSRLYSNGYGLKSNPSLYNKFRQSSGGKKQMRRVSLANKRFRFKAARGDWLGSMDFQY